MFRLDLDKRTKDSPPTKLISRKKILSEMEIPSSTFEDWKNNKGLPIHKIGRSVYVTKKDWESWVEEKRIVNYS